MKDSVNVNFRNLSRVELLGVLEVCDRIHRIKADENFYTHLYDNLNAAFGNVHFVVEVYQKEPFYTLHRTSNTADIDYWAPFLHEHIIEHPTTQLLMNPRSDVGVTDQLPNLSEFYKSKLYNEFFTKVKSQRQMWVIHPHENEFITTFYSREKPYSNHELGMLQLISPHIYSAWINWKKINALKDQLHGLHSSYDDIDSDSLRQRVQVMYALPERQRAVTELVAAGFDNQMIADELKISIRTVHKHLENIFRTLDIHHRTELAARWHEVQPYEI